MPALTTIGVLAGLAASVIALGIAGYSLSQYNDLESSTDGKLASFNADRDNFDELTFGDNSNASALTGFTPENGALVLTVGGFDAMSISPDLIEFTSDELRTNHQTIELIGATTITGTLTTTGSVSADTLASTADATIGGNAAVTGGLTAASLTTPGTLSAADLATTADATIGGNAIVTGSVSADSFSTTADATIGGNAAVTGGLTAASLTTSGSLSAAGAGISGALSVATAEVTGALTAASASVSGNADVTGALTAGSASVGALDVSSSATFADTVDITVSLTVPTATLTGQLDAGDLHSTGGLLVEGDSQLQNLDVAGSASLVDVSASGSATLSAATVSGSSFAASVATLILDSSQAEPTAATPCQRGQFAFGPTTAYLCVATDTWTSWTLTPVT